MKQPTPNKPTAQFLKTDRGKTKSNAIEIPSISLPKGGGAIKGIDEKFTVNAVNGTSAFSIPLPFSSARGATPALNLSYNSGSGNGIFGLGWKLSLSSIKRKTDKGLPKYLDSIDYDTFLFSEVEDLVPEFKKDENGSFLLDPKGDYMIHERNSIDELFTIRRYKPRIEGLFALIERWTAKNSQEIKWRVITGDNATTLYGWTSDSRITDPENDLRIFEWLPEFVFDDKGNCAQYMYKSEDTVGIDETLLHNKNRLKNGDIIYSNRYIEKILYGNKKPYKNFGDFFPLETDYMFQTLFDYGTVTSGDPLDSINNWDFRQDAFSDYKAGFERRTTRLCKRVMLFHVFDDLALMPDLSDKKTLVKSVNFEYDTSSEQDFTFLKSIRLYGYSKKADGSYAHKKLPPFEFEYQKHDWNKELKSLSSEDLIHAPTGFDERQHQFTDLYNEGLSGILTEQANGWYYKHNLGDGKFEQAKLVSPKPSFAGLGGQLQLLDLDADGGKQLVGFAAEPKGYFELDDDNEWEGFHPFKTLPNIDFSDSNTRMLDLNGDGKPEVVISGNQIFTWYASEGREGFSAAKQAAKPFDDEAGPHIVFSNTEQSIYLADMSGDGMTDIVRLKNSEVCYWPNLGYGKFGAKVAMDHAPVFDHPDAFNPSFLLLADIDGSGTADIIYLGKNKFSCWLNLSGNRFSTSPFEIDTFPEVHSRAKVTVTDLLGSGVPCIIWRSMLPADSQMPLKYIDLMNSKKPHLMVSYLNNLGKEVSLQYSPSTKFYIEDKIAGKPWATKLHFPIHCVSKIITEDKISGHKFVSEYKFHHGYYDHPEREFRGFGMVEQIDAETFENWSKGNASNIVEEPLHQEPVITKTWHHTGAFLQHNKIMKQFAEDYWYEEMQRQEFAVTHHETDMPDARLVAAPGIDPSILDNVSAHEWREALRACKGMGLRSEVFAKDAVKFGNTIEARKRELTPFQVTSKNCIIELLQPKGKNKHAIFLVKKGDAITYNYERIPEDPRIAHKLNIKLDEYGNVLESASVVYPRLSPNAEIPSITQEAQNKTVVIYSQNHFTDDVVSDDIHRLRLPSEAKTFELKGVEKSGTYYSPEDFTDILSDTKSDNAFYHQLDKPLTPGKSQRRLIEHVRSTYYHNDLSGPLPLHQLGSLALPYENYQLAYSPELLGDIFGPINIPGSRIHDALMDEGKFVHCMDENNLEDVNWWVRSGTTQYISGAETKLDAQNSFYVPVSYTDPYGSKTKVKYYGSYFLFIEETEDELHNKTNVDLFNFRILSPQRMSDINNNLSEVIVDELGIVKALAVMGKGAQADDLIGTEEITENEQAGIDAFFSIANADGVCDSNMLQSTARQLLGHATTRFVYDLDVYSQTGRPAVVASISRETHHRKEDGSLNPESKIQLGFEYTNGLGKVIMKKAQASPGQAFLCDASGNKTSIDTTPHLRWIGNGRTILNNKGNPVKQYEPYFSGSPKFEDDKELVECGVTPVMYYDAMGRLIKTYLPDSTFTRSGYDSWQQEAWDANDTVLEDECTWFIKRSNRLIDAELIAAGKDPEKEKLAADKAAKHADTPNHLHFDTLGRPVLSVEHNKNLMTDANEYYYTKVILDTEGNLRTLIDARELPENGNKGNTVMQYKYDMLGNKVYQSSMDAGQRWMLTNILGNPLRTWDERNHEFRYTYDVLHRPLSKKVIGGDGSVSLGHIFDRIIYGESATDPELKNLKGKIVKHYDTGGLVDAPEYDFKGQAKFTTRRLFKYYKTVANWVDANLETELETEAFTFTTETDTLGRITKQIAPNLSFIIPTYNEAGLLDGETVTHDSPALTSTYIKNIEYNEKGQRSKIIYGNDASTKFYYDIETFRINRIESKRQTTDPLQDWYYTYDAYGNIINIEDKNIPEAFFNNQKTTGLSEYTYDALYRLREATGRENNTALNFDANDNWNDAPFMHSLSCGATMATWNYKQTYNYDEVGNLKQIKQTGGNNWTRNHEYEKDNNRLKTTQVGAEIYEYIHHPQHGFIMELPHLEEMGWNFKEEFFKATRQKVNPVNGIAETTWYQYDGQGQRIRKITENSAQAGADPTKKDERIYISGYETYKKYMANTPNFERESLSLMDEGHRFVLIETIKQNIQPLPAPSEALGERLVHYQLHNHTDSCALELDGTPQANVISYEEYHPFGTTAFQAKNATIQAAAKRYRYAGMERDEETGLGYHSARYYIPWLGRWASSDPIGIGDGVNLYRYCNNSPLMRSDKGGKQSAPVSDSTSPVQLTPLITQISPVEVSGHLQLRNVFSSNRSASGQFGVSAGLRAGFGLNVPALNLNTTGLAFGTGSASVDTSAGSGQLSLQGGAVLGNLSGLHLSAVGSGSLNFNVPGQIPLNQAGSTFTSALPGASGNLSLHGDLRAGSFSLAYFNASASLDSGQFSASFDANTLLNIGRLHLDATGSIDSSGRPSISTLSANASVNTGLLSFTASGYGTGNADGSLSFNASGGLRILGLQSLQFRGTGTASASGAAFSGSFSGPGPLYTSYIMGDFNLSTTSGISARAGVLGLTYTPGVSVSDPSPPSPGMLAIMGAPQTPWSPSGLTLGASFFQYDQGNVNWISVGLIPDLSSNIFSNLQLGVTAQGHF